MFLGRSFCSWLCPGGGLQDQIGQSRTKRVSVKKIAWAKYVVWASWLGILLYLFRKAGGVKGIHFTFATDQGLSTTNVEALVSYTLVVMVFLLLSLIFGRRTACHSLCWMAPFMVLGRKLGFALSLPTLHLKTLPLKCTSCAKCTKVCPMSLDVQKLVEASRIIDNNCILCGKCKDACAKNVFQWGWK